MIHKQKTPGLDADLGFLFSVIVMHDDRCLMIRVVTDAVICGAQALHRFG
jgi:hypothetical protein